MKSSISRPKFSSTRPSPVIEPDLKPYSTKPFKLIRPANRRPIVRPSKSKSSNLNIFSLRSSSVGQSKNSSSTDENLPNLEELEAKLQAKLKELEKLAEITESTPVTESAEVEYELDQENQYESDQFDYSDED